MNFAPSYKPPSNCSASKWGAIPTLLSLIAWSVIALLLRNCGTCYGAEYHSNPLAPYVLWMDGRNWTATPEQQYQTWKIDAAIYSPFNLDVLLGGDPGTRPDVARVIIGGFSPIPGAAGQSPIGVWHFGTLYRAFGDAFTGAVYSDTLGNDPTLTGVAAAHEAGHLFGLQHSTDPNDVMYPVLTGAVPGWDADNVAFLDAQLGVFAPPDVAPDSPEPPLAILAACYLLMKRSRRDHQPRPSLSDTRWTRVTSSRDARARASASSSALTYSMPGDSCPQVSTRVPSILKRATKGLMRFAVGAHSYSTIGGL